MTDQLNKDLHFAIDVLKQAEQILLHYFQTGIEAKQKSDGSFVTKADQEAERLIRESIAKKYPDDSILGEEEGHSKSGKVGNTRKWIVDPLDGTYNFTRGIPIFSSLLALEEDGEITLGIINAPAVGDTFWASAGGGAFKNGQAISVSAIDRLDASQFNFGSPQRVQKDNLWPGFTNLIAKSYWQRCYGDYLNFTYVFEGKSEAALEIGVHPWDLAPMKVLATESGGRFSDLQGGQSIYTGSCLVSNGHVHDACLKLLIS